MDTRKWQHLKDVVTSLLERDRREWPTSLVNACGDDVDLFLDASSLLARSRSVASFVDRPAWRILPSSADDRS